MHWTLYRYILRDLLKLLTISTVVLVIIISFAVAVKYLAEGLLGPVTLIKFVIYTIPTMLGFALPFAGAFASTLVFSRMSMDNEVTACLASGISYAKVLAPVVVLGVVLTVGLFLLSNFVVPTFYRWAAQTAKTDIITALVNRLDQHRTFVIRSKGVAIYADAAKIRPAPTLRHAVVQPSKLVWLKHVAAVRYAPDGTTEREATAQSATVLLFQHKDQSWVTIRLKNVLFYDPSRGMFDGGRLKTAILNPITLQRPFEYNPKFLSWPQLNAMSRNPNRNPDVHKAREHLRDLLIDAKLSRLLVHGLERGGTNGQAGQVVLEGPEQGERYHVSAPVVDRHGNQIDLASVKGKPVTVVDVAPGDQTQRYEATSAQVTVQGTGFGARPRVVVELNKVKIYDPSDPAHYSQVADTTLPSMIWPRTLHIHGSLRLAAEQVHTPAVRAAVGQVRAQIVTLARDIFAQRHFRAASAVACLLMLLLGAILSMKLVGQMPLVVYLWTFVMAIVTVIIINTGRHMASGGHTYALTTALGVLWAGNLLLAVVVGTLYCWLARH